jgi:very-short-patch-repair endonuclease
MLRSYIDFAINGKSSIVNELQVPDSINVESPFEESVYDYLVANGYNVATQVGCSGFRIDMAIRHPKLNGKFVLGIECDGATYHSARTARERDRLRQMVLENIGWKIYRVWSTDWIKDRNTEGQRLIKNIEEAIISFSEEDLLSDCIHDAQENDNNEAVYADEKNPAEINVNVTEADFYGFQKYRETNVHDVKRDRDDLTYCANVLKYVIQNEFPVHFELLCKRVATLFGNQKATSKVRNYVDYVLNGNLKDEIVRKDDFCWPTAARKAEVRIPKDDCGNRPITYISTDELAEAMYEIADKSFGIKRDDLFVTTARLYGFNRTGGNITLALQLAMDKLDEDQKVNITNDKVTVIKESN